MDLPQLNSAGLKINNFVENYLAIFQTNHRSSNALFAVAVLCCLHLQQIHAAIFLTCVFGVIFKQTGRDRILKLLGVMIATLCLDVQVVPMYQASYNKTETFENETISDSGNESNHHHHEIKLLLINYLVTLMIIFLNSKMHQISPIGNYGICVMYPSVVRYEADKNVKSFLKYILNFAFYKFGMEICWFAVALQIALGHNVVDVVPALMLWFCLASRRTVQQWWTFLRGSLMVALMFKYFIAIQLQPLSIMYKTTIRLPLNFSQLSRNYMSKAEMIWNFVVILLLDRQLWVFLMHWEFYGGSNEEIWKHFDDEDMKNRISDYLVAQKTWLDRLKNFFLPCFPWAVLMFILITSLYTGQLYASVYTILAAQLLLIGSTRFYMYPITYIMYRWKVLTFYTVLVITLKFFAIMLQKFIVGNLNKEYCLLWLMISLKCPKEGLTNADLFEDLVSSTIMDAVYLGLLLVVRRFLGSLYFLHIRDDTRGRDFMDEWGPALLHKATREQNKRSQVVMEKLKATVKNRRGSELIHQAPLKNAVVDQGMKLPLTAKSYVPYNLTAWFWSTTVAFRFTEFSYNKNLKDVKKEKRYFSVESKKPPSAAELDDLWSQFEVTGLSEVLELPRPVQFVHSVWVCVRAHSQYLCFMLVFALQALVYKNKEMLFLPLSVLYASWRHPRTPTWYWNFLLAFTFFLMLAKQRFISIFFFGYLKEYVNSGPPYLEALLFISIVWHKSILSPLGLWYSPLSEEIEPERVATVDVYVAIALLELANLLLVSLTFSSFGAEQSDGGVVAYVSRDNVPLAFLLVLLFHFLSMALDRILYVSAAFKWRGIFHSVVWCSAHGWLFICVPHLTERPFGHHVTQQVYYFIQCTYLLLSAYQVRTQHSRCSAVSVLCQRFSYFNYFLFIIYSKSPFVEAIRRTLDFLFTETKLTREEFVIIESIFEKVYEVKCERVNEYEALMRRKPHRTIKAIAGLIGVFISLVFLASPMIYFIIDEVATTRNPIKLFKMELSSPTLGTIYLQHINRFDELSESDWKTLYHVYNSSRKAKTFLGDFTKQDVVVAHLPRLSLRPWTTSESRADVAAKLRNASELVVQLRWDVERDHPGSQDYGGVTAVVADITRETDIEDAQGSLTHLAEMVSSAEPDLLEPVEIQDILPKYILFTKNNPSQVIRQLSSKHDDGINDVLINLVAISGGKDGWAWQFQENCTTPEYLTHVANLPSDSGCETVDIYLFSDHPPLLPFVKGLGGLIGMYVGVVFGMWRLFAAFWKRELHEIIYDEMVSVDRVLQLCLDIYQSRITREIELELALGQKLIGIFCSPTEIDAWTHGEVGVDPRTRNMV